MFRLSGKSRLEPSQLHVCFRGACIFALCLTAIVSAKTTVTIVRPTPGVLEGSLVNVDVTFERSGSGPAFGSFNLLVTYDATAMTLQDVVPQLIASCGWQYFQYRVGPVDTNSSGAVRVVAVADVDSVAGVPSCYPGPATGTLFTLKFRMGIGANINCTAFPVQLYWNDCADNAFETLAGDSLYLAQDVHSWEAPNPVYPVPSNLQTITGAPNSCLSAPIGTLQPARGIDYRQGYVDVICGEDTLWRGDINLNGFSYEVADAVTFADYFFHGLSAFDPDPWKRTAQIASSDVNADGTVLEFRDLVYLARVASGNAPPILKQQPLDTLAAIFTQNTVAKSVHVVSPRQIAGALLHFDGVIAPIIDLDAPGDFLAIVDTSFGGTNVLLLSGQPGPVQVGTWLTYTGTGTLNAVAAVDFFDSSFVTQIVVETPPLICGDVNNNRHINISDAVFIIAYIFAGGAPPPIPANADVNCSGSISVSDAVYLVRYIFAGGPAPCANCR